VNQVVQPLGEYFLTKRSELRSSQVYSDSTMSTFDVLTIPIENRIFVLEEIDAIGDIVRQRDPNRAVKETVPDELTLAEILTVLDGTLEVRFLTMSATVRYQPTR
jgi:hypothetical protein